MARSTMKPIAEKAFKTKTSKISGRGGFAVRPITKGERLIEYLGERVTHAVADSRYDDYAQKRHHTFLFAVDVRQFSKNPHPRFPIVFAYCQRRSEIAGHRRDNRPSGRGRE